MDTNELLSLAAAGHEAAILELRQQFLPLLYKAANQPHLRPIYAEALSEAEISFLLAIRSYNPDRGIPFPGYAKAMVYGSLRTLFKQERRRWQRELYPAAPADGLSFWDTLPAPQNAMQEYIDSADLLQALSALPRRQRQLLSLLYGQDCTQKAAAAKLGITQQAAAALKARSLRTLRRNLQANVPRT